MSDETEFKAAVSDLINATGDRIANMLEQLVKGNWVDDHGHDVKMNFHMMQMAVALEALGVFRTKHLGYSPFVVPVKEPANG